MKTIYRLLELILAVLIVSGTVSQSYGEEGAGSPLIGWDTILDPDKDCEIKSTIRITVPEVKHDLNPRRDINLFNAPRLLKNVSGDFTAQVKVTGDFDPTVCGGGFLGAGLVVYEDDSHFLRIERIVWNRGTETFCYYPPIEHYRNGNHFGFPPRFVPVSQVYEGRSTWLKIQRKDNKLVISTSNDGQEWRIATERKDIFPEDISVGLIVTNYCGARLTFEFDDFDIQSH